MRKNVLAVSNLGNSSFYKFNGCYAWECANSIRTELLKHWEIGDHYAEMLAKPMLSDDKSSIEWIVPFDVEAPKVTPFAQLTEAEKKSVVDDVKMFIIVLESYANSYKATEDNKFSKTMLGFLKDPEDKLKYPGILPGAFDGTVKSLEPFIFTVNNRPVIVGWGGRAIVNSTYTPKPVENIVKPVVQEPKKSGHGLCLLLGLLLLLLLLLLVLACWLLYPRLTEKPPVVEPPAPPVVETPVTPPVVEAPKPEPVVEPKPIEESKLVEPPKPEPKKEEKPKPKPEPKKEEKPKPKKNDKLDLNKLDDVESIDGKWVVISDLYNMDDNQPVKVHIDLKKGKGTMTLVESRGTRCSGPVSASLGKGILRMYGSTLDCNDGRTKYNKSDVSCKLNKEKKTVCNIINGRNEFDVDVIRE